MPTKSNKRRLSKRTFILLAIYLYLLLASLIYTGTVYKMSQFGDAQIDEVLFYLTNGTEQQTMSFLAAAQDNLLLFFILFFLLLLPVIDFYRDKIMIRVNLAIFGTNRTLNLNPSRISLKVKFIYASVMLLLSIWLLLSSFQAIDYIRSLGQQSKIFESYYVEPREVKLQFPEKKRNLVYIYMESMENTVASSGNGGQMDKSRIPELEKLALDPKNVHFSNQTDGLGGALPASGTTWTVAAMTAQSSGVPLRNNILGLGQNDQGKLKYFVPGAYGLGDVLQREGYNQSFLMGSEAVFGGRDKLLSQHGDYKILDLDYMKRTEKLADNYKVWWGYEDRKLFEYAQEEATRLAAEGEPFNLQLLTADTHFTDGYLDPTCKTQYTRQYDNVHACSSARVAEFVKWLQAQPYAKDTTIILTGDHLGMQAAYYDEVIHEPTYQRTVYNAFLNPAVAPQQANGRLFTSFDMYPSTLAAMGVAIDGDRMALGTNLFSSEKTLLETYGDLYHLNAELDKRSKFYEDKILSSKYK